MNAENDTKGMMEFFHKVENLKSTLRYSETTSGRKESSAEHSWRLGLMTFMVLEDLELDLNKEHAVEIALVHDLAEAITGDIDMIKVKQGEVTEEEKEELEKEAMSDLSDTLPGSISEKIWELWKEYNDKSTEEARFVKALDKVETLTQLAETGHEMYDKPEMIANYADEHVRNFPELKPLLIKVKKELKEEFENGNIEWKQEYGEI